MGGQVRERLLVRDKRLLAAQRDCKVYQVRCDSESYSPPTPLVPA